MCSASAVFPTTRVRFYRLSSSLVVETQYEVSSQGSAVYSDFFEEDKIKRGTKRKDSLQHELFK